MLYHEYAPAPDLREVVSSYWRFALEPEDPPRTISHSVPPDGAISLCYLPTGMVTVVGPRLKALTVPVHTGNAYLGIRFFPGVAGLLLALKPPSLRDRVVPLQLPEFAAAARHFSPQSFDAVVRNWCESRRRHGPDPLVLETVRRILDSDGAAPVAALTSGLNLSYRQILRRFFDAVGLTLKEFARIRRIRAACFQSVQQSDGPAWAHVAAATGFADQSHLVREFRDVFGWPPRLVHEYLSRIEHRGIRR